MKNNKHKKIILLDMHAIIHRAYHALPDFSTSTGEPTGALYGLSNMVLSIVQTFSPDYIIACYDLPGGTFRTEASATYKAHRKKGDDELIHQIERSRELMDAFAIPYYEKKGFEADDLLGTLAETLKQEKENEVIIASGDMDTLQLVDDKRVQVFTLKRGITDTILYDEAAVVARFGFVPKLLPDFKGLRGDPSDNIIGISGIGEKTATTLVTKFGTIENLYTELKKGDEAFRKIGITPRIIGLLRDGEEEALFSKTLATIVRTVPITFSLPEKTWRESFDLSVALKKCKELEFKTLGVRFQNLFEGHAPAEEEVKEEQTSPLEEKKLVVALWLLDSEKTNASMSDVYAYTRTARLADAEKKIYDMLREKGLEEIFQKIELPLISITEAMTKRGVLLDTKYLATLSTKYHKALKKLETNIFRLAGEEFNIKSPKQLSEILFTKLGLPTQGIKKSATGGYSTDIGTLEKLESLHTIIPLVMEYRELQKLLSTYIDVLPGLVHDDGKLHAEFLQNGTTTGRFSSNNPNLQNIPVKTETGKAIRNAFVATPGYKLVSLDYSQIELRIAALLSGDEYLTKAFQEGKDIHTAVAMKVFGVTEECVSREMRRVAKIINFGILYGMGVLALKKNIGGTKEEAQKFYDEYFENFQSIGRYLESTKEFVRKHGYTETLFKRRRYFSGIRSSIPFIRAMAERMAINAPIQGTSADIIKIAMILIHEEFARTGDLEKAFPILQIHDELVFEVPEKDVDTVVPRIQKIMEEVLEKSFLKYKSPIPLVVHASVGDTFGDLK